MLINIEDMSVSLNKADEGKNYDFIGGVYNHKEKRKQFTAFGKKKSWPSGDKYIHINFVPVLEKDAPPKEENKDESKVQEDNQQADKLVELDKAFNDDIPF